MKPPVDTTAQTESRRLKVLLIAYACEPGCGSEPGTGWNMAMSLSAANDVTVVTRANNRPLIESFLDNHRGARPNFIFLDPPAWIVGLKKTGLLPIQIFYAIWQWCVARALRSAPTGRYEIVHQMTFNSFEVPPFAFLNTDALRVWGPVGGGQTVPLRLLSAFGPISGFKEWLRNLRVWISAHNPLCRIILKRSSLVLFANRETQRLLAGDLSRDSDLMIDVGVDIARFAPAARKSINQKTTILFAGRFEHRKGALLLLKAFQQIAAEHREIELRLIGGGPLREHLETYAKRIGPEGKVVFTGLISHTAMQREMAEADIFAFPSIRDTSGAVVLEAMAMGLPVVCFDHQGAAIMIAEGCGIKVPAPSTEVAIKGMAEAIEKLVMDPELASRLGSTAREHVAALYHWGAKAARINKLYQNLVPNAENDLEAASSELKHH